MNEQAPMDRNSRFSYQCQACCRCCHNKLIQLNPYEIARLARHLGISTGEFIANYMTADQPYLLFLPNTACVFLGEQGCTVHGDRPLVCRLYPLGRHMSGEGVESFSQLQPQPGSEGIYGEDGTVQDFLDSQDVAAYMQAADHYLQLFYRLFDRMWADPDMPEQDAGTTTSDRPPQALAQWLDMDTAIANYCQVQDLAVPDDLEQRMQLHIRSIEDLLELARE
jgi:Fe-S-cluster containining protein